MYPSENPIKRWKAKLLSYEWIEEQTGSACYCLSTKTVQMLLTITETLYWKTRWQTTNDEMTPEQITQIQNWAALAEDELMNGCCGESTEILRRVNPVTGEYEKSTDGGETWEPDPYSDPRNTSIQYAPLPGEDGDIKRCKAAENVTRMFQGDVTDFVAALGVITGYAQFVLVLVSTFAVVLSAGVAAPAVAALANVLIGLGASAITATMTTDVYNAFKCIVYCNMDESGKLASGAIQTMKEQIFEEIPEAYDILSLLMDNYGIIGLNNLATLQGAGDGDSCSECACDDAFCVYYDFALDNGGFVSLGNRMVWESGTGWVRDPTTTNSSEIITKEMDDTIITEVSMWFSTPIGGDNNVILRTDSGVENHDQSGVTVSPFNRLFDPPQGSGSVMWFGVDSNEEFTYATIYAIELRGYGVRPTGGEDCEI